MVFLKSLAQPGRDRMRVEVYSARSVPVHERDGRLVMRPLCEACGCVLDDSVGFHMHEALVTRGDLPRSQQDAIWHPYNVALLCPSCHQRGHSSDLERRLVEQLITRYGRDQIEEWLRSLPLRGAKSLAYWGL